PGGGEGKGPNLSNRHPPKFGIASDNFVNLDRKYGRQLQHWNGVDLSLNARPRNGLLIQGGVSTGRTSTDNCAVLAALPESTPAGVFAANTSSYCHIDTPFLSRFAGLASYTIPKIAVQV